MTSIDLNEKCMYKMFTEGELHFIDLVEQQDLEYEGFIRDKKIENVLEEAKENREKDFNEILRCTATITMVDNDIKIDKLDPNPTFTNVCS
jgi:hypothetical protein